MAFEQIERNLHSNLKGFSLLTSVVVTLFFSGTIVSIAPSVVASLNYTNLTGWEVAWVAESFAGGSVKNGSPHADSLFQSFRSDAGRKVAHLSQHVYRLAQNRSCLPVHSPPVFGSAIAVGWKGVSDMSLKNAERRVATTWDGPWYENVLNIR